MPAQQFLFWTCRTHFKEVSKQMNGNELAPGSTLRVVEPSQCPRCNIKELPR